MNCNQFIFFLAISGFLHSAVIVLSPRQDRGPFGFTSVRPLELKIAPIAPAEKILGVKSTSRKIAPVGQSISATSSPAQAAEYGAQTLNISAIGSGGPVQLSVLYPEISRQRGEEGVVDLRVAVNEAGLVQEVIILKSSGFKRLDAEATRAVQSLAGAAQGVRDFRVQFKLDNL